MELKDIINFGYKYYLDENDNFREIINGNDINRTIDENFNNENLQKKWFFSFFNNNQKLHDDDFNNDMGYYDKDEIDDDFNNDMGYYDKDIIDINKNKIFDLLEEILENKKNILKKY